MFTIRVHNYCGDLDDLHDLNIIGPYPDAETRDRDLERLAALPDMACHLEVEPSTVAPEAADRRVHPDQLADAANLTDVLDVL